ncbi:MAG: DNA-deoxyinosine glycosylase, partial [Acidobacteriota bacterium]
ANVSYSARVGKLKDNRIAVWDVLSACEREGADDKRIRNPAANDFEKFFQKYRRIEKIVLNGRKAEELFRTLLLRCQHLPCIARVHAPSTSPANAGMTFEDKVLAWNAALD